MFLTGRHVLTHETLLEPALLSPPAGARQSQVDHTTPPSAVVAITRGGYPPLPPLSSVLHNLLVHHDTPPSAGRRHDTHWRRSHVLGRHPLTHVTAQRCGACRIARKFAAHHGSLLPHTQSDNATNMATPAVVVLDPMDPEEVRKLRLPELRTLTQGYGIGSTRRRKNVLLKAVLDFMREHAPPLTPWTARDLSTHDAAVALRLRNQPVPDDPDVAKAMLALFLLGQQPPAQATPASDPSADQAAPPPEVAPAPTPAPAPAPDDACPTPDIRARSATDAVSAMLWWDRRKARTSSLILLRVRLPDVSEAMLSLHSGCRLYEPLC